MNKNVATTGLITLPQSPGSILEPYTTLSRRQFLVRSSLLAAASSVLILPKALRATGLIEPNALPSENSIRILNNIIYFNGERRDPLTNLYHLGQGYRAYNPTLMRFHAADSLSPFGEGGLNAYAYTLGNPINMIDPSGHFSFFSGLMDAIGLVVSIGVLAVGVATLNPLLIASGGLGITSSVTGIASSALENSNPKAAAVLNKISIATGIGSLALDLFSIIPAVKGMVTGAKAAKTVSQTWGGAARSVQILDHGGAAYIFEDTIRGGTRLNIMAHGTAPASGIGTARMVIGGVGHDAAGVYHALQTRGVNFKQYQALRTITCYSANGGNNSLAAGLSRLTGLRTKGYIGPVSTTYGSDHIAKYFRQARGMGFSDGDIISAMEGNVKIAIAKPKNYYPFNSRYWTNYKPVTFTSPKPVL